MRSALAAFAIAAIVVSCTATATALRVVRFSDMPGINEFEPFDQAITDRAVARDLSATIDALPAARANVFCAAGFGLRYRLDFAAMPLPRTVVVEGDGCRLAHLGPLDVRETTELFWAKLAEALGLYTRGNELFPLPSGMRR